MRTFIQGCKWIAWIFLVSFMTSGCAVLTKSQLAQVREFAKAGDDFATLPARPIEALGETKRFNLIVNASTRSRTDTNVDLVWRSLREANETASDYAQAGRQLNAAVEVLDQYANLLGGLASEDFINDLNASAKKLGQSLDKAAREYNATFEPRPGGELNLFGETVAAAFRGAGGILLRRKQARLIRAYVNEADDMVARVTENYAEILKSSVLPRIEEAENRLRDDVEAAMNRVPLPKDGKSRETDALVPGLRGLDIPVSIAVADELKRLRNTRELATKAIELGPRFRKAHAELKASLSKRRDLKETIEEIQLLLDELETAQKLRKELDK